MLRFLVPQTRLIAYPTSNRSERCEPIRRALSSLGPFLLRKVCLLKYLPVWPDSRFTRMRQMNEFPMGFGDSICLTPFFPGAFHRSFLVACLRALFVVAFSIFRVGICSGQAEVPLAAAWAVSS